MFAFYVFVRRHCQETLEWGDTVQAIQILNDAISRIPVAGFYQQRAKLYVETGNCQKAVLLEMRVLYQAMDERRKSK